MSPTGLLVSGVAVALAIGGAVAAWNHHGEAEYQRGHDAATLVANSRIDGQIIEAGKKLREAQKERDAVRDDFQKFKDTQELKDEQNKKTSAAAARQLADLAGASKRLRDPNATPGCRSSGGAGAQAPGNVAGDRADDRAETSGLLSEQLSGLLLARIKEADAINDAYASCRPYALKAQGIAR